LDAVLDAARKEGVDELLILGDLVGYYFHPDRVLALLEPWSKVMIRGNHEESLAQARVSARSLQSYEKRYGSGLRVALQTLNSQQLDELTALPNRKRLKSGTYNILMCHWSTWDTDQYIYPDADLEVFIRCFEGADDMIVAGHTHYSLLKKVGDSIFVNPGSVGQPRDWKPGAAWALLDTDCGEVSLRRESYDIDAVVAEARAAHPDMPYLFEVLLRQ